MIKLTEMNEDELNEMGYGTARHDDHAFGSTTQKTIQKPVAASKYHVKHKISGKVLSTHNNAVDAVKSRKKIGGDATHSIVKEENDSSDEVLGLIQAMTTGKTVEITESFKAIMASKMIAELESRKETISRELFAQV